VGGLGVVGVLEYDTDITTKVETLDIGWTKPEEKRRNKIRGMYMQVQHLSFKFQKDQYPQCITRHSRTNET
jgi:hypothetical protein